VVLYQVLILYRNDLNLKVTEKFRFKSILKLQKIDQNQTMSTHDDCTRKVSKGMISLMKLLDSYDECIDVSDQENSENLVLPLNDPRANVKHSRRYIWDEECHQEDAPSIRVSGVKENMKTLQDEIKKKTLQVTELKTVMARKRLAKERNVKKFLEDREKRMESLKQEYDKVSVCALC